MNKYKCAALVLGVGLFSVVSAADDPNAIPSGSKVYIAEMNGLRGYLAAELQKKAVPLVIVAKKEDAEFEIDGTSAEKKAGAAKIMFGSGLPEVDAAVTVTNMKTGVVVLASSSHKSDAWRGKKSAAAQIAKEIREKVEQD